MFKNISKKYSNCVIFKNLQILVDHKIILGFQNFINIS